MRPSVVVLLAVALALALATAGPAAAADTGWRSQQPPLGPGGAPTPLGPVGDLECWQADRCVLTTAGNSGMPAGIYAYDGGGWYLYSTVCGGREGRIAWAGPTEFWTVSDQPLGQEGSGSGSQLSLCHFKDGAVVASYAQPRGVASSYLPMNGAACLSPAECWFGGERLPETANVGAFHLYWIGFALLEAPSLTKVQEGIENPGRTVFSIAAHDGGLYESVIAQAGDKGPEEPPGQPYFLHRIVPGTVPEFAPVAPSQPLDYGPGAGPEDLLGFHLSDDGEGLWAVSGARNPGEPVALRLAGGVLEQLELSETVPDTFLPGDRVAGVGAEPGAGAAWVAFSRAADPAAGPARVARVLSDGTVEAPFALSPEGEGVGNKGRAGPIECVAPGQCWLATDQGWLFHLGPDPGANADPALHTLITFRPPDASLPTVAPVELPEDNSGANVEKGPELELVPEEQLPRTIPPLVSKIRQRLIGGRVLELSFLLRRKARVRLIARRAGKVVARSRPYTMAKGRRQIRLRLNPERWPTKLDLKAKAVKRRGGAG